MPDPESHSPPGDAAASPLHHPTLSAAAKGAARFDSNDESRLTRHPLHKVSEITLRPISTGVLFLAATIQTAGDMLQLSCSEPAELMESTLGYAGKVEDITLKPLVPTGS